MVGDLARGRTVRSLSYLMKNYHDVKLLFVSPPTLRMEGDLKEFLDKRNIPWSEYARLEDVVDQADAIYMTRIQDEHDTHGESKDIDLHDFTFHYRFLDRMKPDAILMHPLPRRDEIDRRVDQDPRAMYWRQVRNGMWMRTAVIATVFNVDPMIEDFFQQQ